MNRLKEASLVKNGGNLYGSFEENGDIEEDEDRQMKEIVEQFEVFGEKFVNFINLRV